MSRYKAGDRFIIEIEEETEEIPGVFKVKGDKTGLYRETFFERLEWVSGSRKMEEINQAEYEKGKTAGIEETLKWMKTENEDCYRQGFYDTVTLLKTLMYLKDIVSKEMDIAVILNELQKE